MSVYSHSSTTGTASVEYKTKECSRKEFRQQSNGRCKYIIVVKTNYPVFIVCSLVCSVCSQKNQQTQVETLLNELKDVLIKVTRVSGDEIVKFLPDIFDALFLILVDPIESIQSELKSVRQSLVIQSRFFEDATLLTETCDRPVFECLVSFFPPVVSFFVNPSIPLCLLTLCCHHA